MAKGICRCCGNEYTINADGTMRYHIVADPECRDENDADSRKCRGAGQLPRGLPETVTGYICRVPAGPEGCGRPVQVTSNGRARSHLDNRNHRCAGGSDWPIRVSERGERTDMAPGEVLPAAAPEDLRMSDVATAGDTSWQEPGPVDTFGRAQDGRPHPDGPCTCTRAPGDLEGPAVDCLVHGDPAILSDVTHKLTDSSGTEWIHPGEAGDCRLPECCTHPEGFVYADDDNGHSGSFCPVCDAPEPERVPGPDDWRTPADLLARMPEGIRRMAECNPECWDCGHEITPLVERFGMHGAPEVIVWGCKPNCEHAERRASHYGAPCRPQLPEQERLGNLDEGDYFVRHITRGVVLVFRVTERESSDVVSAVVVSPGPYAGRKGELTNLNEEITCTNHEGTPRPRRTSRPSSPARAVPGPTNPAPGSKPITKASAPAATSTTSSRVTSSGPTAGDSAGTSTRTVPMTDAQEAADFLTAASGSYGEAEAKYGRWGRYKLRHPVTGKEVEWTRATTFAKSISDTFTLSQWGKRNVLVGATMRKDIVALAHGKDVSKDREQLNTWCEDLEQAAGSKVAANLGTAVHSFTERVDRNWERRWEVLREETPEEFRPHVEAYILLLEEHGLVPVPHMIEFSTGVLQYEVMGTSDNCYRATRHLVLKMPRGELRLSPGEHVIGDKKTGKDLDYGWQEICIQLALYAQGVNTQGIFNWADETWDADPLSRFAEPGTKVREDVGVILHLPVDERSTKKPGIHGVDLESGWAAAVLCERVRVWRKLRNLAGPVAVVDVVDDAGLREYGNVEAGLTGPVYDALTVAVNKPAKATRPPTFRERAEAVTSQTEASRVYQDAVAAKVPVAEAKELISIMQAKIAQIAEPGGAKV